MKKTRRINNRFRNLREELKETKESVNLLWKLVRKKEEAEGVLRKTIELDEKIIKQYEEKESVLEARIELLSIGKRDWKREAIKYMRLSTILFLMIFGVTIANFL